MRPTTPLRPPQPTDAQTRRRHRIAFVAAAFALLSAMPGPVAGAADAESARRATEIEAYLPAHPRRALIEIPPLLAAADTAPSTQRQLLAMQGQAFVLSGRIDDAQVLSDRLESEARVTSDPRGLATALLLRSAVQSSIGDAGTATLRTRRAHCPGNGRSVSDALGADEDRDHAARARPPRGVHGQLAEHWSPSGGPSLSPIERALPALVQLT
jgi:hypothetical protein